MFGSQATDLVERYQQPHRRYHDLGHILGGLEEFKHVRTPSIVHHDLALTAWWYHDSVYDPLSKTNEEDSAALARYHLSQTQHEDAIAEVERLILLTKTHLVHPSDENGSILCSVDLAPLGKPWEGFERNTGLIRQEYVEVPERDWVNGRISWMRGMLERPLIYPNPVFWAMYEQQARENLSRSLDLFLLEKERIGA